MPDEYTVHGAPISLFTRKLEAALRFYGAPFGMQSKAGPRAAEVESRSGTHQIPVLETPENWMIADTTPLIALLDSRFPDRRLVPEGPLGVLVHVVEEVLDEWVARVMVHYRWHHDENTRHVVGKMLGKQVSLDEAREFPVAQWGRRACRATGTDDASQREAAEREYSSLLSALETQLGSTRFALGDRPTAADAIFLGGLRAHINHDPVPKLEAYPRCVAWDEKQADRWDGGGELAPFPASTPFADHLLDLARDQYLPFVLGNARALAQGEKAFVAETYGEPVSYLTRRYPEQSRQMVLERIRRRLDNGERRAVAAWLEERGLAQAFMP